MKKILLTIAILLLGFTILPVKALAANWIPSGSNINYVENNGKVGIGTGLPHALLDIWKDADNVELLKIAGNKGAIFTFNTYDNYGLMTTDGSMVYRFDSNGNNPSQYFALQRSDGGFLYKVDGYGNSFVDGKLTARQVVVKANIWADYVFDDSYKLMPLNKVEEYINSNKHLPNIPSSKEIDGSGVDLGEIQRLQMEKIEELTLYAIEQEKRIERLERLLNL